MRAIECKHKENDRRLQKQYINEINDKDMTK